jgi:hypothetical protein
VIFSRISRLFARRPRHRVHEDIKVPAIHFAQSAYEGLIDCLAPARLARHEGVALLLGHIAGKKVMVLQCVRPQALTSRGSFQIPGRQMARVVGLAMDLDLHIVGQVHTHPQEAYHSKGDEEGANIRYDGFVSIVIPDYGIDLPMRTGWAVYRFNDTDGWVRLNDNCVSVIDGSAAL